VNKEMDKHTRNLKKISSQGVSSKVLSSKQKKRLLIKREKRKDEAKWLVLTTDFDCTVLKK